MEKFMYLFRNQGNPMAGLSESEASEHMQKWGAWMGDLANRGLLIGGEPLYTEGKQVNGKSKIITDGPFIEAKEVVGGYLIVNANTLDDAVELSKDCPIFERDGKVEVRQIQKMEF